MTERNWCALLSLTHFICLIQRKMKRIHTEKKCIHFISWMAVFFPHILNINFPIHLLAASMFPFRRVLSRSLHSPPVGNVFVWICLRCECTFFLAILFWSSQYFLLTVISHFAPVCVLYYYHKIALLPAWLHPFLIEISRLHESITKIRWPGKLNTHWHFCQNNSKKTCANKHNFMHEYHDWSISYLIAMILYMWLVLSELS